MILIEEYNAELELVRQNPALLDNYRFDKNALNSKHFDRLKLNIAIYNNTKSEDFEIAKFLFIEEMEWRKCDEDDKADCSKDEEVDNLYFSAFVLTLFGLPEVIWLFFETKNIDFDSGSGFDGEYLVFTGITETYQYVKTADNPLKKQLLAYIGETEESCQYTQDDIIDWKESKKSYFRNFKFPIKDELYFFYLTNEKELFLRKLPEWLEQERAWDYEALGTYRTYAAYTGDKMMEIEALKLTLEKNDKYFLTNIFREELAILYIDTSENIQAFEILEAVIEVTDNKNVVRNCVEQLCRIVSNTKNASDEIANKSYKMIIRQQEKYKIFSPYVDDLIRVVARE